MQTLERKAILDKIIARYKGQDVGYEIIVRRENYKAFVADVINNDFKIEALGWWEWCEERNKNRYGMGGPISKYYNGWFSEINAYDELNFSNDIDTSQVIDAIINLIEAKVISYPDETITFKECNVLTPAFYLSVPDDWKSVAE